MRILIIEDEVELAKPVRRFLQRNAFAVDYAPDGKAGLDLALANNYDCILLDLNLPKLDGLEVASKLRHNHNQTPILMLTARTRQDQIWEGFENGTDDYMTKPFDLKELLLRVQALIRRSSRNQEAVLQAGAVELDPQTRSVRVSGELVELNSKEYGILEYLLRNKNKLVSTEELLEHVWDREIDMFTQTVRTNMKTLRRKIDPDKTFIKNIRGQGYVIR